MSSSSSRGGGVDSSSSSKRQHGGEIVTIQCGTIANWIGTQYHLLQNSNCDVNAPYQRHTHFRRSAVGGSNGGGGAWMPRVVSLDASVGLDGVVATYGAQESSAYSTQERALQQYQAEKKQEGASAAAAAASRPGAGRPKHWSDLSKNVLTYHSKSLYSMPGLYEGTSDFHLHEQGCALMSRESVHEEVLDRVRWFLEECDQPDGIHLLVEANSGWSGVGSTMLSLLRDEYEKIPIFCMSALLPPPPSSLLGSTFASATPLVQSVLNSSLLLNQATQLASAYLPLTSHCWASSESAQSATTPQLHQAIQRGEMYETASLMALQIHFATASYRAHPRSLNMATALGGVTQQSQANVLALKVLPDLEHEQLQAPSVDSLRESSSAAAATPTLHTQPSAVPLSLLGHSHVYPPAKLNVTLEPYSSFGDSVSATGCSTLCDRNRSLTESLHVLGNTEELSHQQVLERAHAQPPALYRDASGSTRLNLPPSFSASFHSLVAQGGVASLYRCQGVGDELRSLGTWLASLHRGSVISSVYAARDSALPLDSAPNFLLTARRARLHGDKSTEKAEQFDLSFTQEQLEEISECGVSLQNLAELY